MKQVTCCECERKREPHRVVAKLPDGSLTFVCKQCYKALYWYVEDNGEDPPQLQPYLFEPMNDIDREILRKLR